MFLVFTGIGAAQKAATSSTDGNFYRSPKIRMNRSSPVFSLHFLMSRWAAGCSSPPTKVKIRLQGSLGQCPRKTS